MAIRADSYSSTSEVLAFTRHLLDGETAFNSTTRPTATEVEKFIDRASSHLNVALTKAGLSASSVRANSTAKLMGDDWVTQRAAEYVELTQRGVGFNDQENQRWWAFRNMQKAADGFVSEVALGLKYLGVTVPHPTSAGLSFTGLDERSQRTDPTITTREQPKFRRGLFNYPGSDEMSSSELDEDA